MLEMIEKRIKSLEEKIKEMQKCADCGSINLVPLESEVRSSSLEDLLVNKNIMSTLFKLNLSDFVKGGILAVITALLVYLQQMLTGDVFSFSSLGAAAGSAFIAYLIKNLATDEQGKLLGSI